MRCVSQTSIILTVNIEGEIHKFHVSPFQDASEIDTDNLVRCVFLYLLHLANAKSYSGKNNLEIKTVNYSDFV